MLKSLKNIFLILIILVTAGVVSGCCAMKKSNINVVFVGAHEELGLEDYCERIKFGEGISFELNIPVGYDHEGLKIYVNDSNFAWDEDDVLYEDAKFKEETNKNYRYTTKKTISIVIPRLLGDSVVKVDMTKVTRRAFDLEISSDLLKVAGTVVNNSIAQTNLSVVSVSPDSIGRLVSVNPSNTLAERPVVGNKATVYYGEYILLCYSKPSDNAPEISTIYSRPNSFTKESDKLYYGDTAYLKYDVAKKGNAYYHIYRSAIAATASRLYYIGLIEEGYTLQKTIPDYVVPKNMTLQKDYNRFSLLTSPAELNSDILSIKVYQPTQNNNVVEGGDSITIDGTTTQLEPATKVDMSEYNDNLYRRYDRYDMYIGNNQTSDPLLTADERTNMPSKLYVAISSTVVEDDTSVNSVGWGNKIEDYMNFHFLFHERQSPFLEHVSVEQLTISNNGKKFIVIDKELVEGYIVPKVESGSNAPYQAGNAILHVEFDGEYLSACAYGIDGRQLPYVRFDTCLYLNGIRMGYSKDYSINFYYKDGEGTFKYGALVRQAYDEDLSYFRKTDLFEDDGTCKKNFYVYIQGVDYNGFYTPIITTIKIHKHQGELVEGPIQITNQVIFNGIEEGLLLDLKKADSDQFKMHIYLSVSSVQDAAYDVSFENINFGSNDAAIYMTNNVTFVDDTDFFRLTNLTKNYDANIKFGADQDIFYFVATDTPIDFNIYKEVNGVKHLISETKQLKDICGNALTIHLTSGQMFYVYVKYQTVDIYDTNTQLEYLAINNSEG